MSNFGFIPTNIPTNPPNPIFILDDDHQQFFQPSDYDLMLSIGGSEADKTISFNAYPSQEITGAAPNIPVDCASASELPWSISDVQEEENGGMGKGNSEEGSRIAFRTKSDLEIMDDGFKWRKYGKKKVKNSPNPRNYYKCSSGGCNVKKRVERDREDPRFVITTYEGVHNHHTPCAMYSNGIPPMDFPWTSSHPFSSQLRKS